MQIWVEETEDARYLRIGYYIILRIPDVNDRNPEGWWNIETLTGIHASRIASAWKGSVNEPLMDAMDMISAEIAAVPDDAFSTIQTMRTAIIRDRIRRSPGYLPFLFVGRAELVVNRVRELLEDVFGGALFTMTSKAGIVGAVLFMRDGKIEVHKIENEAKAESVLLRAIRFAKPGTVPKNAPKTKIVPPTGSNPPPIVCRDLVSIPPSWPRLDGVVRTPLVKEDGSILAPGYDPETRLWYDPDPSLLAIKIPERPSLEDVLRARETLWEPFSQFPFVDGPAPLMCAIFEQFLIKLLGTANRPIYAIEAPSHGQGSGKTTTAQMVGIVLTGEVPPGRSRGSKNNDEELEKRVTSFLLEDALYHLIDNVSHHVASDALALLTTSPMWSGRILGVSKSPPLPNKATWVITLNDGSFSKDLIRRIVMIRYNANKRDAFKGREFKIRYPLVWMKENRARIIEAVLTIIRAWIQAGRWTNPQVKTLRGGFETWMDIVASVVTWAGFNGLVEALTEAEQRDPQLKEDDEYLTSWAVRFGYDGVQAQSACELAQALGLYAKTFETPQKGTWVARRFANDVLVRLVSAGRLYMQGAAGSRYFYLVPEQVDATPSSMTQMTVNDLQAV